MKSPRVSILINNFNYAHFVGAAIDSALGQTYPNVEVIVVDDGSTDHSRQVIEAYAERIVPVFKKNGGQGSTFNAGFAASTGEIVCMLDADDEFLPRKVAAIVERFESQPGIGWVFHPLRLVDVGTGSRLPPEVNEPSRAIDFRPLIRRGKSPTFAPATSGLCFTRGLLGRIFPMPEIEGTSADRFLKLMALALDRGYYLDEELSIQKVHGSNAHTQSGNRMRVGAKSLLLVACWLQQRVPDTRKLCNKFFAMSQAMYRLSGGIDPRYAEVIDNYWASLSLSERVEAKLRTLYHQRPRLRLSLPQRGEAKRSPVGA